MVAAARGKTVFDFALRRMHGIDAGIKGARAFSIAGVAATSNVAAGEVYGLPIAGTMAHSYIQAHDDEKEALRRFASLYPNTTLLVADAMTGEIERARDRRARRAEARGRFVPDAFPR